MVEIARKNVRLTVNPAHVNIQMGHVSVLQDGRVIIVPQVRFFIEYLMFKQIRILGTKQKQLAITTV